MQLSPSEFEPIAKPTSGTVVMLMTSHPHDRNALLSARLENLGPSMVTIVPLSCTPRPSSLQAPTRTSLVRSQNAGHIGMWQTVPKGPFPPLA